MRQLPHGHAKYDIIMKILFAIPTYNRVERLKVLVGSILAQEFNRAEVELYCAISNSCSTDDTSDYINSLQSDKVKLLIHNQVEHENGRVKYVNGKDNFLHLANLIPRDVNWVWFMGDDDYLIDKNAISILSAVIRDQDDLELKLVHACQARRSCRTGQIIKGTLFDLCNGMGFHEVLGWMSSLIVDRDLFVSAMTGDSFRRSESAYAHSAALLEVCHQYNALFIDAAWVEPQDERQTQESIERWQKDNMGERYFYVVDDLVSLYERKVLTKKCSTIFFRYLTYSFWDRYICYLIGDAANSKQISQRALEHWNRVLKTADMLEDPAQQKIYRICVKSVFSEVEGYMKQLNEVNQKKTKLLELIGNQRLAVYPFTNLYKVKP